MDTYIINLFANDCCVNKRLKLEILHFHQCLMPSISLFNQEVDTMKFAGLPKIYVLAVIKLYDNSSCLERA